MSGSDAPGERSPAGPGGPAGILRAATTGRALAGILAAAGVVLAFHLGGFEAAANDALQVMGFDPDRARLLTALVATGMAAAIVALADGPTALAVAVGLVAAVAGFGRTALAETRAALAANGTQGVFDPFGWVVSMATLVVVAAVAAWAAAVLAREVRRAAVRAVVALGVAARAPGDLRVRLRGGAASAAAVLAAIAVVALLLPTFGDMLNFDPDVHMRRDAAVGTGGAGAGAFGAGGTTGAAGSGATTGAPGAGRRGRPGTPGATFGSAVPADVAGYPAGLVAGPVAGSLVTPGAVATSRPWASSAPAGRGRIVSTMLPAPWTGGSSTTAGVDVYLPPGYDGGTARYPVLYEAPYAAGTWGNGMALPGVLDTLITSGALPPEIVVFVSAYGGPYPDSECADSYDGREWFDRFVSTDVVSWVDQHLRTIATAASRATLGFSQGGYCAAALTAHHPDVFGSAIILSGYFTAGLRSGTTPNAWRPFNADPAIIDAVSPITVVPRIPPQARPGLFFVMTADPTNGLYGVQMRDFAAVLDAAGIAQALLPSTLGHSWDAGRQILPTMLELVAGRMVTLGVFGPA